MILNITNPIQLIGGEGAVQFIDTIQPFVILMVGIIIYALFIFHFYRFLAHRDVLKLKLHRFSKGFSGFMKLFSHIFLYILENLVIIPILTFFWFGVLAVLLLIMTKAQNPDGVLLSAMALIGAVRVTSYYNEDLSRDLAKLVPFGLLAVYIVSLQIISLGSVWSTIVGFVEAIPILLNYFFLVVSLEMFLRIVLIIRSIIKPQDLDGFKVEENKE